jgi:hypothetical protein
LLSSTVSKKENEFLIRYTGILDVKEAGEYSFGLSATGGIGSFLIDEKEIIPFNEIQSKPVNLPAGKIPVEFLYSKYISWEKASLGLTVSSGDVREFLISDPSTILNETIDPILVEATTNTLLRSFMDIPGGIRIVHAVSVGNPKQLNFTYDLDRGMLLQAWRGAFLDATPMWHDRGDGSSRPLGSLLYFGDPAFTIQKHPSAGSVWNNDTTGSGFQTKGYEVDVQNNPTFKYNIYGAKVSDGISVSDNGQALKRTISIEQASGDLFIRLGSGKSIQEVSKGLYLMDDKSYYIRIDDLNGATPVLRDSGGRKELLVPVKSNLSYSILF